MQMDEQIQGALPTGGAMPPPEVQAAPVAPPQDNNVQKYLDELQQGRKALDDRRMRLLQLSQTRKNPMFDPKLLALAGGLLAPTKTGGFGESLGKGMEAYGVEQEKSLAQQQAEEKMQFEIEQMAEEQKRKMTSQKMMAELLRSGQGAVPSGAPMGGAPVGGAAPVAGAAPAKSRIESLSDDQLYAIAQADQEGAKFIQSVIENRRKGQELGFKQREVESKEASQKGFVPGIGTMEMPKQFFDQLKAAKEFPEIVAIYKEYKLPINLVDTTEGGKRFMTAGEMETKTKGAETTTTERSKSSEKVRESILERGDQAPNMINTVDSVYALASNPSTSGAFGILAKPGVKSALATAVAEGIKVGNYNVGFPAIEDAIRKIGGTQAEIDAALMAARSSAELELGFRRTFLTGQGSVSNMEGEVTRRLGPSISDSPKIAMAKSEVIKARSLFDQKAANLLQDWEDRNPNKNAYEFKRSPDYKALVDDYSAHLKDLSSKYFPTKGAAPSSERPKSSTKSLLEQIRGQR